VLLHCTIFSVTCLVKQVARELLSVTGVVSQCFSMRNVAHSVARNRIQIYFPQHIAATCSVIVQCITLPATFLSIFEPHSLQMHAQIYHFALKRSGYEAFSAYLGQKYWKLLRTIAQWNTAQQLVSQQHCETSCCENCAV